MPRKKYPANVIGPKVRKLREKAGISQDAFSGHCQLAGWDISRSTLAQIESRIRFVSDEELMILAALLGVSTDALYPEDLVKRLRRKRVRLSGK